MYTTDWFAAALTRDVVALGHVFDLKVPGGVQWLYGIVAARSRARSAVQVGLEAVCNQARVYVDLSARGNR